MSEGPYHGSTSRSPLITSSVYRRKPISSFEFRLKGSQLFSTNVDLSKRCGYSVQALLLPVYYEKGKLKNNWWLGIFNFDSPSNKHIFLIVDIVVDVVVVVCLFVFCFCFLFVLFFNKREI